MWRLQVQSNRALLVGCMIYVNADAVPGTNSLKPVTEGIQISH
jgi:hypothetical protein